MDAEVPPEGEIRSQFEGLKPEPAAGDGGPLFRGTHQYEHVTVERTYHLTDGVLAIETAYLDGEDLLTVTDESWLLDGRTVRQTGESLESFCRRHHFEDSVADVAFCLHESTTETRDRLPEADVTSTFQPASTVQIDDGTALRYEGSHQAGQARVERAFFVSESKATLRVQTTYYWDDERLGCLREAEDLLDDGEFVASTGEPIGAFCRRTHLVDPEADIRYCARLGSGRMEPEPEDR